MALKPLNDTIFGELVSEEGLDDLARVLHDASRAYRQTFESKNLDSQIDTAERQLTATLKQSKKLHYMVVVNETGPDCRELQKGDTAILPPHGGTMITVIDEQTNQPRRVFCISERVVLARWRND